MNKRMIYGVRTVTFNKAYRWVNLPNASSDADEAVVE